MGYEVGDVEAGGFAFLAGAEEGAENDAQAFGVILEFVCSVCEVVAAGLDAADESADIGHDLAAFFGSETCCC